MILRPVVEPAWLLVVLALVLAALLVLGARRRGPLGRWALVRRGLMSALVLLMLLGPSVPGEAQRVTSTTEVWFVIDRTGSMAAEDWDGDRPRLDGVKEDLHTVLESMAGARFSVRTWDSDVRTVVPLTTDESAIGSFIDTFSQELSEYSQGSSLDRPTTRLLADLAAARESHPEDVRYLFVLSDGETSNEVASPQPDAWAPLRQYVDGGLVIGYGTEEGGHMRVHRLGDGTQDSTGAQSGAAPEWIRDYSQPGAPPAVSRIDEAALESAASELGVAYVHSPGSDVIRREASAMMADAELIVDSREELSTYRYLIWPLALALGALAAWEGAALAGRVRALRRAHAV
ncbi:vWA domain-containing protein [Actinomyces polynesiensis]|uniref:vWA domain-containing protein n=1 Tax=Actinomyces polynesiensis TaxID=1325934 RepID=UPI0005B90135|nr:VWA domain-containing protein [Actinomyces polynesiensis]